MQSDGLNSALSPVVYGDIPLSIKNKITITLFQTGLTIYTQVPNNSLLIGACFWLHAFHVSVLSIRF